MPLGLQLDIHCHLIPGIDEGSRSLAESLVMARALERLGVTSVHVTPHQFRFENDLGNDVFRTKAAQLAEHLRASGVGIKIVPGAEYLMSERLLDALEHREELMSWPHVSEAGAASCVLVELPLRDPIVNVGRTVPLFLRRGLQPVMAHPERVQALAMEPRRVFHWRDAGWRFQLDLLSLAGTYGRSAQHLSTLFLSEGLYDFVGSDLHRSVQTGDLAGAHDEFRRLQSPHEDPA